ncbi:MAG TPA: sugar ABC transporter substrate-binding protein [Aggregatilineales bacterium]|nr:sugar ABC transporter substrate-binding protein [Aggregatilineales bacterium]
MSRLNKKIALVLTLMLALSVALITSNATSTLAAGKTIAVVVHGQAADPFWSVFKKGVDQAGKDLGVTVTYNAPATFDMPAMAKLIDAAVAAKVDGLVVSIPDADALGPSIKKAVAAGIPVISVNSGSDKSQALGTIAHIGQEEYDAGFGAGQKYADAGVKNALCVIHEQGNAGLEARCQGFSDALKKANAKVANLAVDLKDPTGVQQKLSAALTADSTIDGVLLLGPSVIDPAVKAFGSNLGKIKLATFDLSPTALDQIAAGNMLFAIDQQQYTQGYLAIVYMSLYLNNLDTPGSFKVATGPGFVTKDNVDKVKALVAAGTR